MRRKRYCVRRRWSIALCSCYGGTAVWKEIEFESLLSLFMEDVLTIKGVHNVIKLLEDKALSCEEMPYGAVIATLKLLRGAEKELGLP